MRNRNCIEYFPSVFRIFTVFYIFSHVNLPFWNTIHKIFFRTIILNLNSVWRPIIFLFRWYQGFYTVHARLNRFIQFSAFEWTIYYLYLFGPNHIVHMSSVHVIWFVSFWSILYTSTHIIYYFGLFHMVHIVCSYHMDHMIWSISYLLTVQSSICFFRLSICVWTSVSWKLRLGIIFIWIVSQVNLTWLQFWTH